MGECSAVDEHNKHIMISGVSFVVATLVCLLWTSVHPHQGRDFLWRDIGRQNPDRPRKLSYPTGSIVFFVMGYGILLTQEAQ